MKTKPTKAGIDRRAAAGRILTALKEHYPKARCSLDYGNALELLVATILSAQCTDERVNLVTKELFRKYRSAADYAAASQEELERDIQSTGFFRNKAKALRGMAEALVREHGGEVPRTMEALTALPGVGRKTANVVLGNAFGISEGVVVDTHVGRLAQRLGLSRHEEPGKIEQDLAELFPRAEWTLLAHLLIAHGRAVCQARKPKCGECFLVGECPTGKKLMGK